MHTKFRLCFKVKMTAFTLKAQGVKIQYFRCDGKLLLSAIGIQFIRNESTSTVSNVKGYE